MQSIGALEVRGVANDGSPIDDTAFGFKHQLSDRTFLWWSDGVLAHHGTGNDETVDTGFGGRNLKTGLVYGYNQALERRHLPADPGDKFAYERNFFLDVHKPNYEVLQEYEDISPGYGPLDGFTVFNDARGPLYQSDFTATTPGLKSWTGFFGGDRLLTRDGTVRSADFFGTTDIVTNGLIHANFSLANSELNDPFLTGGVSRPFNQATLTMGFRDGTPAPLDAFYGAGNFGTVYLQQFNVASTRQIGTRLSIQATYAGTHERSASAPVDGQLLRSVALGESLGPDSSATIAFRSINGDGGFALPGKNFSAAFHSKFRNGSEIFVNYGTPASPLTLNRLIVKYVLRIGGGAGT
jgi:hypothetical protein